MGITVLYKNGGIALNDALGFTGDVKLLYTTGEITPGLEFWSRQGLLDRAAHLVLPSLVLITTAIAFYGRYQRNAMLDVLGSDFLRTARAKGLRRSRALVKHGLRTALIPMATFFAYQFALLFVGATFTERIFGWHGMGEYFVDSIIKNDVNSVAAVTLFVAVLVLIAGFLADLAYALLEIHACAPDAMPSLPEPEKTASAIVQPQAVIEPTSVEEATSRWPWCGAASSARPARSSAS